MHRVLVTGATGFVGRHVLAALASTPHEVHAVSRTRPSQPNVAWHSADLLERTAVVRVVRDVRPTHLLHLAWSAVPGVYVTSLENLDWLEASVELLRAFGDAGGRRFVGIGTCAEYAESDRACSETATPLRAANIYAATKHAFATVLDAYAQQTGISSAWARLFHSYGPHEHPSRVMPDVIRALLEGREARCTAGEQIRDFLFIEDLASALVTLLFSNVTGPVNVASGVPVRLRDALASIAEQIGRADLLRLGALPMRPGDPPVLYADVRRLRDEVGWRPSVALDEGLQSTIRWWRADCLRSNAI